ncbi:hypothetical protein CL655_03835 [bacterium]|mgnify:FL=1|nr:hypothetical protein [bacterium]|tara:strand:+ start:1649 stop:2515 length:867 start_codon:yes stop_codon:yes gene_type:complete
MSRWAKTKRTQRTSDPAKRMIVRQVIIGVLLLALLALAVTGVWHLTRAPALTISEVTAAGGLTIAPATVVETVEAELVGTYYRLIPKRFSYLYPKGRMLERLEQIPRIKDFAIKRTERTKLHITFTEYEPYALWCDGEERNCVFIDDTGYGFADAPELSGGTFIRYQNASQAPAVGQAGVPSTVLLTASSFVDTASAAFGFRPQTVWFDDRDVVYRLGGGGEIRTSRADTLGTTLANLETILASEQFAHLAPGNFEYIDLRYGNKVFVQEAVLEVATSTSSSTQPVGE